MEEEEEEEKEEVAIVRSAPDGSDNECGLRHHPKCTVAVYHSWRTCKPSKRGARKEHTELFFFQLSAPRIG